MWRRDCSASFHLTPYQGKYEAPKQAPDGLEIQQLLAGMADRDADVAVVECDAFGLDQGRCDGIIGLLAAAALHFAICLL